MKVIVILVTDHNCNCKQENCDHYNTYIGKVFHEKDMEKAKKWFKEEQQRHGISCDLEVCEVVEYDKKK